MLEGGWVGVIDNGDGAAPMVASKEFLKLFASVAVGYTTGLM